MAKKVLSHVKLIKCVKIAHFFVHAMSELLTLKTLELTTFVSPMSQWVWVKYILLCNSFVLSRIEAIFGIKVLWDNRYQPHTSLLW